LSGVPFRHVAMFRWADHVDADHVQRVRETYDELGSVVPGLRHHAHGADVGVSEGTFDYLVVADFESVADWRVYRDHPIHVLLVEELVSGHVVEQVAGQFQVHDDRDAHDVSAARMQSLLAEPDETMEDRHADESDEELLARARRAAMADMQDLLAEPDDRG
jgi:hypothetical protein